MSGLKLVIPTTFTDTTLPVLRDDPVLSSGSLALIDLTHPASPLAAGVPSNAANIPNIAHKEFATLLSVSDTGFPAKFATTDTISGVKGKVERTAKGGLHAIISQNPGIVNGSDGLKITLDTAIRNYLYANRSHTFYFSVWDRYTRKSIATAGVQYEYGSSANSEQMLFFRSNQINAPGDSGETYGSALADTVGPRFMASSAPANSSALSHAPENAGPEWGQYSGAYNSAVGGWNVQLPSFATYRFYVEDLTASGRTFTQAQTVDLAEYNRQVLTAGGRYYGDTFTDPATIP